MSALRLLTTTTKPLLQHLRDSSSERNDADLVQKVYVLRETSCMNAIDTSALVYAIDVQEEDNVVEI